MTGRNRRDSAAVHPYGMEIATFAKLFSGSVRGLFGALLIAAQPYTPPGRAVFDPGLAGLYGPMRVATDSGKPFGPWDEVSFAPDGKGGYRVRVSERDRAYLFRGRLYEDWGARILELVPEQDLGWEGKTKGKPLLIGYSNSHGELALTELARGRSVHRFYRQKKSL
ncbi:MAG: hypothetical protein FD126_1147 [Elusimicrobia bacterium]|nr:MAG: hypothetical protein FD126_1147 [Elusimicrobiota bacterium]